MLGSIPRSPTNSMTCVSFENGVSGVPAVFILRRGQWSAPHQGRSIRLPDMESSCGSVVDKASPAKSPMPPEIARSTSTAVPREGYTSILQWIGAVPNLGEWIWVNGHHLIGQLTSMCTSRGSRGAQRHGVAEETRQPSNVLWSEQLIRKLIDHSNCRSIYKLGGKLSFGFIFIHRSCR